MLNSLVSIIIPAYNHEKYIQDSIKSSIIQSYDNIELIVINDGSKDKTHEKIIELEKLCKKRFVKYTYINQLNEGLSKTLNKAIKISKGEFISFHASDDCLDKEKISILIKEFTKLSNEYAMVCGNAKFINQDNEYLFFDRIGNSYLENRNDLIETFLDKYTITDKAFNYKYDDWNFKSIITSNYIPAPCTLIRKSYLMDLGYFNEKIVTEDLDLWLRMFKKYKVKYSDNIVAYYRLHGNNSIVYLNDKIINDTIKLLLSNKLYCKNNNLYKEWNQRIIEEIIKALKFKKYRYLENLKDVDLYILVSFIFFKIVKKIKVYNSK